MSLSLSPLGSIKSKSFKSRNWTLLLVALVAVFGGFLFGYDTAVINGANQYLKTHFALDSVGEGMAGASAILGCIPGAMVAGWFSDRYGRRKILFACCFLFAGSGIMSALPSTFTEFLVARFISGIAIGISSMICPVYIAEMAPKDWRGRLGSMFQFGIVTGIFFTLFINAHIQSLGNEAWNTVRGWRWMFAAEVAPSVLLLVAVLFAKESPRWLIQSGRELEARLIFQKIGSESFALSELEAVKLATDQETGRFSELFGRRFRRPLIIAVALMAFSQFSGINAIMYYSTKIFTTAGIGLKNSFAATALSGLVNLLFTFIAMALVDKVGRRGLLLVGFVAQTCALAAIGWMFYVGTNGMALVVAILSFIAAFAMSLGPIPWILSSEIFPNRVRGRAMSVATFVIWTSCYIVAQTFPMLNDDPHIGPALTFWIYAGSSLFGFLFVLAMVPETKGRSLEEIEMSWLKQAT